MVDFDDDSMDHLLFRALSAFIFPSRVPDLFTDENRRIVSEPQKPRRISVFLFSSARCASWWETRGAPKAKDYL